MSEPKKPAGRDISDLKARLGLKKGAEGGAAPRAGQGGGIPAPTAAKIGGFVPPPPGVQTPPPAGGPPQPQIPDASTDPFGAMNAMASAAKVHVPAQPEFVIVNDGKPVEQVSSGGKAVRVVKYGAIILAPLFLGWIFGGVNEKKKLSNETIRNAKALYGDFDTVGKGLNELLMILDEAKSRGRGEFALNDKKLIEALEALKLEKPNPNVLFATATGRLDSGLMQTTFQFYMDLIRLYEQVEDLKRAAKRDERKATPKQNGAYAMVLRMPKPDEQGAFPSVEMVELGAPICKGDTKVNPNGCSPEAPPEKFQVRSDPQGPFAQILPWASKEVAADSILMLGNTKVQSAFMVGADAFVDVVAYKKAITEIDTRARELAETGGKIKTGLNATAQDEPGFTL